MRRWRWATPAEKAALDKLPDPDPLKNFRPGVFPVVSGTVRSRTEEVLEVPAGKVVALLDHDWEESWCYRTEDVTVRLADGTESKLRPGLLVAIFAEAHLNA